MFSETFLQFLRKEVDNQKNAMIELRHQRGILMKAHSRMMDMMMCMMMAKTVRFTASWK